MKIFKDNDFDAYWRDMNLEQAIQWYTKKRNNEEKEKYRKEYNKDMKATLDRVNAEKEKEAKKVEQELINQQKQFEIDKRSWSYPPVLRQGLQGNVTGSIVDQQIQTAQLVTSAAYTSFITVNRGVNQWGRSELEIRAELEREYQVKLKAEMDRLRKELRGEEGSSVDVDILAQGRKFKLDGE